ncbi:hypothetical protein Q4F19_14505 [Sphingomonas sp. BIUV-7]|uniref:PepSY domain-containing protein n=1 Tax=Sphingomonas natans TaxID=3063330 RepID=A0ABT8YB89_9SPHN|nr:hypothetical protein [Sphingomonas sp. BIUV-7]MDO6415598.1 hypothetical protein [Sphingomonas sp. BIUV-7]
MRIKILGAVLATTLATGVFAQADTGSHNPAVKNATAHTTEMAAKGRNSFTESQARGRIEKAGYANVGKLAKNKNGVWQGMASKDGGKVNVALDYKGNVTVH